MDNVYDSAVLWFTLRALRFCQRFCLFKGVCDCPLYCAQTYCSFYHTIKLGWGKENHAEYFWYGFRNGAFPGVPALNTPSPNISLANKVLFHVLDAIKEYHLLDHLFFLKTREATDVAFPNAEVVSVPSDYVVAEEMYECAREGNEEDVCNIIDLSSNSSHSSYALCSEKYHCQFPALSMSIRVSKVQQKTENAICEPVKYSNLEASVQIKDGFIPNAQELLEVQSTSDERSL